MALSKEIDTLFKDTTNIVGIKNLSSYYNKLDWIDQYVRDKFLLDSSDFYVKYYCKNRINPYTEPLYSLYIRGKLDPDNFEHICAYLKYSPWTIESSFPVEVTEDQYRRYVHSLTINAIEQYYNWKNNTRNLIIQGMESMVNLCT